LAAATVPHERAPRRTKSALSMHVPFRSHVLVSSLSKRARGRGGVNGWSASNAILCFPVRSSRFSILTRPGIRRIDCRNCRTPRRGHRSSEILLLLSTFQHSTVSAALQVQQSHGSGEPPCTGLAVTTSTDQSASRGWARKPRRRAGLHGQGASQCGGHYRCLCAWPPAAPEAPAELNLPRLPPDLLQYLEQG